MNLLQVKEGTGSRENPSEESDFHPKMHFFTAINVAVGDTSGILFMLNTFTLHSQLKAHKAVYKHQTKKCNRNK